MMPEYLADVSKGIRAYLLPFFFRYVPELDGVFLGYTKFRRLDEVAHLPEGSLWGVMVFDVEVNCVVMQPSAGRLLLGEVKTIRPTHVGVLLHGLFSASIAKESLRKRYKYQDGVYKSRSHRGAAIRPNSYIVFRVRKHDYTDSGDLLSIGGDLDDPATTGVSDAQGQLIADDAADSD
eukprot:Selendium_serpulae@DN3448_c0_g1_i1.p2